MTVLKVRNKNETKVTINLSISSTVLFCSILSLCVVSKKKGMMIDFLLKKTIFLIDFDRNFLSFIKKLLNSHKKGGFIKKETKEESKKKREGEKK